MGKEKKKIKTKKFKKSTPAKVKKKTTTKKLKPVMIKSSEKNIVKKAKILEEIDPIIINLSSSDNNVLRKTKSRKFTKKFKSKKINKAESIEKIILNNKKNAVKVSVEQEEVENNKGWAILSYLCAPYVFVMKRDSSYVSYHTKRGMVVFLAEVLYLVLYYLSIEKIKAPTSCDNFPHYSFSKPCLATPWWVNFSWGIIALILVSIVVKLIKKVLIEEVVPKEVLN